MVLYIYLYRLCIAPKLSGPVGRQREDITLSERPLPEEVKIKSQVSAQYKLKGNHVNSSLMPSPLSRMQREGVWPNVYRACAACATYSARQSDARIKSHDCAGMNGMHTNDCVCAHSYEI